MKLLVKIPTKWRGLEWLDKWLDYSSVCTFLVSVDNDEYTDSQLPKLKRVIFELGESQNKIHAINRDVEKHISSFDILAVFGDDFEPTKGFDKKIIETFKHYKEKSFGNGYFCLHFNDGYTDNRLGTYPIMGREYWERFGYVYNPAYRSIYADNEQTEVAQIMKRYVYLPEVVCKHRHYVNDRLAQKDELYTKNEKLEVGDKETYLKRKAQNFDVKLDWKVVNLAL